MLGSLRAPLGFRKVDPDRWEFANEGFLGGQKHLLKHIRRRRNISQNMQHHCSGGATVELGQYGLDGELERDRSMLMVEIVRLRQQQQQSRDQIAAMEERLQSTEKKQQMTMAFLAKALNNPSFVQKFSSLRGFEGIEIRRKRRLPSSPSIENLEESVPSQPLMGDGQDVTFTDPELANIETELETLVSGFWITSQVVMFRTQEEAQCIKVVRQYGRSY